MHKTIVAIGGGELRNKTTKAIDEYVANLGKAHAEGVRATAVFIGTASHDSFPYFNTFRKTYTSDFDVKADLALLTKKDIPLANIERKFEKADIIYIGGGNTVYMLDVWKETGLLELLFKAYESGTVIAGLSAGAICWFDKMYTDSAVEGEYKVHKGIGLLRGMMTPHYNLRPEFDELVAGKKGIAYAVEDNAAIVFEDGVLKGSLSSGGNAYIFRNGEKSIIEAIKSK